MDSASSFPFPYFSFPRCVPFLGDADAGSSAGFLFHSLLLCVPRVVSPSLCLFLPSLCLFLPSPSLSLFSFPIPVFGSASELLRPPHHSPNLGQPFLPFRGFPCLFLFGPSSYIEHPNSWSPSILLLAAMFPFHPCSISCPVLFHTSLLSTAPTLPLHGFVTNGVVVVPLLLHVERLSRHTAPVWGHSTSGVVCGGFGMTPWCDDHVCSWRRLLADRHSLPFPWTLSLHRRWCPSASHHPLTFLFLLALTFPLPSPFPSLVLSLCRPPCPSASPHSFPSLSLGRLCQRSPRTYPVSLLCVESTQRKANAFAVGQVRPSGHPKPAVRYLSPTAAGGPWDGHLRGRFPDGGT